MTALIEELFSYSLYESEQNSLEFTDICLNDCIEKSLTQFYNLISECCITPKIDITEGAIKRRLDAKALERIIAEL